MTLPEGAAGLGGPCSLGFQVGLAVGWRFRTVPASWKLGVISRLHNGYPPGVSITRPAPALPWGRKTTC